MYTVWYVGIFFLYIKNVLLAPILHDFSLSVLFSILPWVQRNVIVFSLTVSSIRKLRNPFRVIQPPFLFRYLYDLYRVGTEVLSMWMYTSITVLKISVYLQMHHCNNNIFRPCDRTGVHTIIPEHKLTESDGQADIPFESTYSIRPERGPLEIVGTTQQRKKPLEKLKQFV